MRTETLKTKLGKSFTLDTFESTEELLGRPHDLSDSSWTWGGEVPSEVLTRLKEGRADPATWNYFQKEQGIAASYLQDFVSSSRTRRFRHVWSDNGDEVDAGRVLAGEEKCWREIRRGKVAAVVRIGIGTTLSSSHSPSTFAVWISRAVALIDALVVSGIGVEVMAVGCHYDHSKGYYASLCPVKRADEPLDVQRLCSLGTVALCRAFTNYRIREDPALRFSGCGYPCLDNTVLEMTDLDTAIGQCYLSSKTGWEAVMPFLKVLQDRMQ